MIEVDESKLSKKDRLGLAWCRLNCYAWDEILGPKPSGFEAMPDFSTKQLFRKKRQCKHDYVLPAMRAIESIIGRANISRCWWLFQLGRTEEEWFQWYVTERFR